VNVKVYEVAQELKTVQINEHNKMVTLNIKDVMLIYQKNISFTPLNFG